jgi:arginyl-tRNA synthetase
MEGQLVAALTEAARLCGYPTEENEVGQSIDMARGYGDISSTIALRIGKKLDKNPIDIANAIASKTKMPKCIKEITKENGFINFHIDREIFPVLVLPEILKQKDSYTRSNLGNGKKAIVEYPSVNPVHPWHVGQVRSALLGDTVANIMERCGYITERIDYIDDLGLQVAEVIWGWLHPGVLNDYIQGEDLKSIDLLLGLSKPNLTTPKDGKGKRVDYIIGEIYVAVNKYMNDHKIDDQVKDVLKLMEQPGTREAKLARSIAEYYVRAEYETAFAYNMYHSALIWESDIIRDRMLERALDKLKGSKIVKVATDEKYANCLVIDFNSVENLPQEFKGLKEEVKVLIRSNGTPNYLAKDIAFHMWKFGIIPSSFTYTKFIDKQPNGVALYTTGAEGAQMDFGDASIAVNTIDSRQSYEQALVRLAIKETGYPQKASGFKHLAYGIVELESGALAGRKGTWIGYTADDLLREAREKALSLIGERFKLSDEEKVGIANETALSAIKFEFLRLSSEKNLVFSWERALNFEGNSGPYCEYMYARSTRIMENAGVKDGALGMAEFALLNSEIEFELIKKMSIAKDILEKSCNEYKPNMIVEYMCELALLFGKFYEQKQVLKATTDAERVARLAIVECFRTVMQGMFRACGVNPINRM